MDFGGIWPAPVLLASALVVGAALATFALTLALYPLMERYALARPNARSSHAHPTPQGAGMAIVAVTVIAAALCAVLFPGFGAPALAPILAAAIGLAVVGAVDDIRTLEALPRLAIQSVAVLAVLVALPPQFHVLPPVPLLLERAVLFVALLWFVNLVNFMDGIDWMTVAEVVPLTVGLALFGFLGALPSEGTLLALALGGAMLGFAPLNRPVARVFLGDVGSLPIGLMLGWLLVLLAAHHLVAALLLPLYFLADATITLLRRFAKGERVMQAHRSHFYQRATVGGLSVSAVVGRVAMLNVGLIVLAAATILNPSLLVQVAALALGCVMVGALLYRFDRAKS
jgi:UDP-N-acetylmuramyl pentapeptide phosphotransferase/UDP-N-acetylglucosamine-1-phosphate transferase